MLLLLLLLLLRLVTAVPQAIVGHGSSPQHTLVKLFVPRSQ
jgi:hypothetical protein